MSDMHEGFVNIGMRVAWSQKFKQQAYCGRRSHWWACTQPSESRCLPHRWCKVNRVPGSSPGQKTSRPHTPHIRYRGKRRSANKRPVPAGTQCTAHIVQRRCWSRSCTCRRIWRHWSRCRESPSASGRYTECTVCTSPCGCSSLSRSHLQVRGRNQTESEEK